MGLRSIWRLWREDRARNKVERRIAIHDLGEAIEKALELGEQAEAILAEQPDRKVQLILNEILEGLHDIRDVLDRSNDLELVSKTIGHCTAVIEDILSGLKS